MDVIVYASPKALLDSEHTRSASFYQNRLGHMGVSSEHSIYYSIGLGSIQSMLRLARVHAATFAREQRCDRSTVGIIACTQTDWL